MRPLVREPTRGADGVLIVTLKPTTFQNTRTVEETEGERKEDMRQLVSGLVWDMRNEVTGRITADDSELPQRLDALEKKLVADHCSHAPEWYNDNIKFKGAFKGLHTDADKARKEVFDKNSYLSRSLT